jgi:hypothetical protein
MACDCDGLNNQLRNLNDRIRRLEDANRRSSGGGSGGGGNDDLIERVFKDERWLAAVDCFKVILRGNA